MAAPPKRLQDRVAIITGASSGIGRACAEAFAAEAARLVLIARNQSALREVAARCQQLGSAVAPLVVDGDIADAAVWQTAVARAVKEWGRLDILVNNAGIGHNLLFEELSWEQIVRIFQTNVSGALLGIRAALFQMKRQPLIDIGGRQLRGQIINVSSVVAFKGVPQLGVYCATKSALRALTESLRIELQLHAIEVIGIYPGTTRTDFFRRAYTDGRPWLVEPRAAMSAERVAGAILRAALGHRREVVLTISGKILMYSARFFPRLTDWGTAAIFKHYRKRRQVAQHQTPS
jgi:short-subunit dehydrogenase